VLESIFENGLLTPSLQFGCNLVTAIFVPW